MRIAVSVALLALLAACGQRVVRGSGEAVEEDLDLDGFDQVQVADALTVVILPAEQDRVTLVGDDNVVDEVQADVDGDRLELSVDDRVTLADADLVVEVRVRELTALTASGASSVTLDRDLDAEELRVQLSGSSVMEGEVSLTALEAEASGASRLLLTGTADRASVSASGSSELDLGDLTVTDLRVTFSGASRGDVVATGTLSVGLSGASELTYARDPELRDQEITGASSLEGVD